ncbi:MAG: DUF2783 domain-containing protein [Rhodobacteraceae bacterium]|nr:DUF2783 domain-containing protein [Paracoccaceae bacterium]
MTLKTDLNIADPDALYAALLAAHKGLSAEGSAALNAELILLLMNHVGDVGVIRAALDLARQGKV